MEICNTKEKLIELYRNEYEEQYYIPFLKLSLTKLGNLNDNNPVKLTDSQRTAIKEKLNDDNFSSKTFFDGLELLTFDQISYVGW